MWAGWWKNCSLSKFADDTKLGKWLMCSMAEIQSRKTLVIRTRKPLQNSAEEVRSSVGGQNNPMYQYRLRTGWVALLLKWARSYGGCQIECKPSVLIRQSYIKRIMVSRVWQFIIPFYLFSTGEATPVSSSRHPTSDDWGDIWEGL